MTLQFDPSPYMALWQRQQQLNQRPDLNQTVTQPLLQGLQMASDNRRQQQLMDLQRQKLTQDQAQEQQKNAYEYGAPIDPNAMVAMPGNQNAQSAFMPGGVPNAGPVRAPAFQPYSQGGVQGPFAPGAGASGTSPVSSPGRLVDAFNSWRAGGMKATEAQPEFMAALGKDERKAFADQNKPEANYVAPQYDAAGNVTGWTPLPSGAKPAAIARPLNPNANDYRNEQEQNRLEQQGRQGVENLRGDKSLARSEEQRDAAITAYKRIQEIKKSGGQINPIDYTDILGQIYKARTGSAPTEQIMGEIRQSTAKGDIGKAFTYMTGQQSPATSQDILASLENMAASMGTQSDQFHDAYMKSHLIKPHGLDDERWQPIAAAQRGISFKDATGYSENSGSTRGTVTFTDSDGQMHTIPAANLDRARQRDPGLRVVTQ